MSGSTQGGQKGRRGRFIWTFGAVAFISALLYWEQAAPLYVLPTLAMCGLLLVVAFSDLEGRGKELSEPTLNDKAAPAGEMTTAASPYRGRRVTKRIYEDAA